MVSKGGDSMNEENEKKDFYERFWWLPMLISSVASLISAIAVLTAVR